MSVHQTQTASPSAASHLSQFTMVRGNDNKGGKEKTPATNTTNDTITNNIQQKTQTLATNTTNDQGPPATNDQLPQPTQKEKNREPKFYDSIDQTIFKIQSLGIIEYGRKLGLEKREILDEVEIWVKKREEFVSDELKYIFEQPAKSEARVNEYENYQMLSFAKDAKYKYNPELAEQDKKLVPSLQLNLLDDYHAFIASIKNMIRKEREELEEENKEE